MWLLAAAALPVIATAAQSDGDTLRWSDVAAAVDRDPRFVSASAEAAAAAAAVRVASAAPNPELEGTLGRGRAREGDVQRNEWGLSIDVPLGWLARRGPNVSAARAEAAGADAEAAALRRDVLAELHRMYVAAAFDQELTATLVATEEQVATLAALVRRRVEAGEARPVEVPRIEIEVERVRSELAAAESDRRFSLAQLSTWLGRPVDRVEVPPPVPAPTAVTGEAHPRVRAAEARLAAARAAVDATRRERLPEFSVGAFYASELDRSAAGVTFSATLPLWNWGRPEVARASARAQAEAARAEAARREVTTLMLQAEAACERSASEAERQLTRIVPRAEDSARTLQRSFELGEANLIDVIDARRVLLDARRSALASARQRESDCGTSLNLSGREIP